MSDITNNSHSEEFKFNVAIAALYGSKSVPELCQEFKIVPSQIYAWKKLLAYEGPKLFVDRRRTENKDQEMISALNTSLEKVTNERDFLVRAFNRLP